MLSSDVDLAAQNQMKPVLARMLRVTIDAVGIPFDPNIPVFMVGNIKPSIGNGVVIGRRRRIGYIR
jgi:hypothetical protein